MAKGQRYRRYLFLHVNKFQQQIMYPALVACFAGCILALLSLDYFYYDRTALLHKMQHLKEIAVFFIPMVAIVLVLMAAWIYKVTNRVTGPYERIVREMDAILEGKKEGPLSVRKGDELFSELLIRVNRFIDRGRS